MLTTMTESEWAIVLQVFRASSRGAATRAGTTASFSKRCSSGPQHHVARASTPVRPLEQCVETVLAIEPVRNLRGLLRCACGHERDGASGADVRFHRRARPCLRGRRKRGQEDQALGRSRGGVSTKIHLKVDLDGLPLAFHLTGGEASDCRNFEVLLDIGPDVRPPGGRKPDRDRLRNLRSTAERFGAVDPGHRNSCGEARTDAAPGGGGCWFLLRQE